MTIQQLKYVVEIAKSGSMNEASKNLYVSQPSLSSSIKELEREMGINIFDRTNRGIKLSLEGGEFLMYAKQVLEQLELLEDKFINKKQKLKRFAISTQHYAFVVEAFSKLMDKIDIEKYEFNLRETKTWDIIKDVKNLKSELGFIYLSKKNEKVMLKIFNDNDLEFEILFKATPHIFISADNPLANKDYVTFKDLEKYPCLSFEQGSESSLFFEEELLHNYNHNKNIRVTDRATLFNLLIGAKGYTISTGFINSDLNGGRKIISIPLKSNELIKIGYLKNKKSTLSSLSKEYLEILKDIIDNSYKN